MATTCVVLGVGVGATTTRLGSVLLEFELPEFFIVMAVKPKAKTPITTKAIINGRFRIFLNLLKGRSLLAGSCRGN